MTIQFFRTKQEAEEEKGKLVGWNAVVAREWQPDDPEAYEGDERDHEYLYAIAAKNEGRLVYLRTDGYFR